jgi:hypothetical protein
MQIRKFVNILCSFSLSFDTQKLFSKFIITLSFGLKLSRDKTKGERELS